MSLVPNPFRPFIHPKVRPSPVEQPTVGGLQDKILKTTFNQYHSYSGSDITASIFIPPVNVPDRYSAMAKFKVFAELQTVTVSSQRSVAPVRRLGESQVAHYTRGQRTVAGTLIFSVLSRDVFSEIYQPSTNDGGDSRFFIDQLPPFHILIDGVNEYGHQASQVIFGVTLTNFGTTYSIDDILVESTYTYVAQAVQPFMERKNWKFIREMWQAQNQFNIKTATKVMNESALNGDFSSNDYWDALNTFVDSTSNSVSSDKIVSSRVSRR